MDLNTLVIGSEENVGTTLVIFQADSQAACLRYVRIYKARHRILEDRRALL